MFNYPFYIKQLFSLCNACFEFSLFSKFFLKALNIFLHIQNHVVLYTLLLSYYVISIATKIYVLVEEKKNSSVKCKRKRIKQCTRKEPENKWRYLQNKTIPNIICIIIIFIDSQYYWCGAGCSKHMNLYTDHVYRSGQIRSDYILLPILICF